MELHFIQLILISAILKFRYGATSCVKYESTSTKTCTNWFGWKCKKKYKLLMRCCEGYRGEHEPWSTTKPSSGCSIPRCHRKYGTSSCSVKTGSVMHRNGTIVTQSGGKCVSPSICEQCNEGYYPEREDDGYCRACVKPAHCHLPSCKSADYVTCTYCDGEYIPEKLGYNVYTHKPDPTKCQRTCSWMEGARCFPGVCNESMILAKNCVCAYGFTGPDCATVTEKQMPEILKHILRLEDSSNKPVIVEKSHQGIVIWTKELFWSRIVLDASTKYTPDFKASAGPNYINNSVIGIEEMTLEATLLRDGHQSVWKMKSSNCKVSSETCKENVIKPLSEIPEWNKIFNGDVSFKHADRIKFSVSAKNGGTITYEDRSSFDRKEYSLKQYSLRGITTTETLELGFDMFPPEHCIEANYCIEDALHAQDILKEPEVTVHWDGWFDRLSDIGRYELWIWHLVLEVDGDMSSSLNHNQLISPSITIANSTHSSATLELGDPGPYSIEIIVYDKAENIKIARRVIFFDNASVVERLGNFPLGISQATSNGWINKFSKTIEISWPNRYRNVKHSGNGWLNDVTDVAGLLDDRKGRSSRTIEKIVNIKGIVRFEIAFRIELNGQSTYTNFSPVPDEYFHSQKMIYNNVNFTDGKKITYTVRAYDIVDEYAEDNVTVMIDLSPPVIRNLWLTKGTFKNISVHSALELSDLTIEWETFDYHSGIHKVAWQIFDNFTNNVVVHGESHEPPQGETKKLDECNQMYGLYPRGPNCYCSPYNGCFHSHYQIKPPVSIGNNSGLHAENAIGEHDYDYFIKVIVENNAGLITVQHKKITIDTSPPCEGTVHDGIPGEPEVDFQQSLQVAGHWGGFFDKESSVWFYSYGFGKRCLHEYDLDIRSDRQVNWTYGNRAEFTADTSGKYHLTVMSYNHALGHSKPVCSDGVVVDVNPAVVSEVIVKHAVTASGLVKSEGNETVYILHRNRELQEVFLPPQICKHRATVVMNSTLQLYPHKRRINGTVSFVQLNDHCNDLYGVKSDLIAYITSDSRVDMSWNVTFGAGNVHDYEVGIASENSKFPDVMDFTSSHHHQHIRLFHPDIFNGEHFYIMIKAITKSSVVDIKVIGPFLYDSTKPDFTGTIDLSVEHTANDTFLIARWAVNAFSDHGDPNALTYEAAIGSEKNARDIIPFHKFSIGGSCNSLLPPTCTSFSTHSLPWHLHGEHYYFVTIKASDTTGHFVTASSKRYRHNIELASKGIVQDVEETPKEFVDIDDIDFQTSTSKLSTTWSGFEHPHVDINIIVCISNASSDDYMLCTRSGGTGRHDFTDLDLEPYETYYHTVIAETEAGNVTAVSDGVTIVVDGDEIKGIQVFDGLPCNGSNLRDLNVSTSHHVEDKRLNCKTDKDFQSSTNVLQANWNIPKEKSHYLGDIYWAIDERAPVAEIWKMHTGYQHLRTTASYLEESGLSLSPGRTYRVSIQFCAKQFCFKPVKSNGVTVIPNPPATGNMSVTYAANKSLIEVSLEPFKDSDIEDLSQSRKVIDHYEWAFADESILGRLLTKWQRISHTGSSTDTPLHFAIDLPEKISFTKCWTLAMRGYTKVGLSSTVSSEIRNCKDLQEVRPSVVIDAVGEPLSSEDDNVGKDIYLEENGIWKQSDKEYTPYSNILSAVWPTLRYSYYTWAVLLIKEEDPTIFYDRSEKLDLSNPCDHPDAITCGGTVHEFINVKFEPGELKHGNRYIICIHANATNLQHEFWEQELEEAKECSTGVTVDITPPVAADVWIGHEKHTLFQTSTSELTVNWNSFTDVEEEGHAAHASGITHYEVALGTSTGGIDVQPFTDVGLTNHKTFHNLKLQSGHTYFATVNAFDFTGQFASSVSEGIKVDTTPPLFTDASITLPARHISNTKFVEACWIGVFSDLESGISRYSWALGTHAGYDDMFLFDDTEEECAQTPQNKPLSLKEGHAYFVTVKAYNKAGLYTATSSWAFVVEETPPVLGIVYDGPPGSDGSCVDVDYIDNKVNLQVHWKGFHDPHSTIVEYFVNIGSCENCEDVLVKQPVGTVSGIVFTYLQLSEGLHYYVTVTACNTANLCSSKSSDGFVVDSTPPVAGLVTDGVLGNDLQYQASRNYLGCKWAGFTDPQSGISHYVWRVGTNKGGDNILQAADVHKDEESFVFNLYSEYGIYLPKGVRIYCTVRAYNKAGKFAEVSSNGFIVDDSPPTCTTQLSMSPIGTITNHTTVLRTTLKVHWDVQDSESFIESQHLSISSHIGGDFNLTSTTVEGIVRDYTFTDLDFHDGSYYCIKLISCNGANLCTESVLADILVDSTKPTHGTFAINTDHAAALNRQPERWMTWTPISLNLAWLEFEDVHSDIHSYTVNIGSQYMGNDLNEEPYIPMIVQHSQNGPFHEDGKVQMFHFRTQSLSLNKTVFISVIATNHVGLSSAVVHSQFNLLYGEIMELVRRCDSYSCLGHCVCAPSGNTCHSYKTCNNISGTDNMNTIIEVKDYLDLRFPDTYPHPFHSPVNTMLAAKWSVTSLKGARPVLYEWSVGETIYDSPSGVFDTVTDRVWHDAGQNNSCIFTVDRGRKVLEEHKMYSVFVRVWYDSDTYAVFKSIGVTIFHTPPLSIVIKGKQVKEVVTGTTRDVDFITRNTHVEAYWTGKFGGNISRYHLYVSTHPGGHDLRIVSKNLHPHITSFNITGLTYDDNTKYYTVVQAFNLAGLHTTEVSDGFMLDIQSPTDGIVMDGLVLFDKHATADTSRVQSFWHGFSDIGSGIQTYEYCVSSGVITGTCDIKPLSPVGIATRIQFYPKVQLEQGSLVRGEVRARDTVGHVSRLVSSNGVIIDTSAPVRTKMVECQQSILNDSSFENIIHLEENSTVCDNISDTQWKLSSGTCVSLAKSSMSQDGEFNLHLLGSISQNVNTVLHGKYKLTFYTSAIPSKMLQLSAIEGYTLVNAQRHVFMLYSKPNTGMYAWQKHVFFFHSDSNITTVEFGTVKSRVAFAIDGIQFQLCEVSAYETTDKAEGHVNVHTVFVHDWSSIHADWSFTDLETDILEYMWAIGTVQGGTQLQPFVSVGRRTFASNNTLRLEHNAEVFITVVAINAAGLRTVSYSDPIMIDLTPPQCKYVNDGPILGEDLDFIRGLKLDSHWDISDPESGIKECHWALGTSQGETSVQAFVEIQPNIKNASKLFQISPPETIFVTVRCTNGAGLTRTCYSDGVKLLQTPPSVDDVVLELLTTSQTQYKPRNPYHSNSTEIRFLWTGFRSDEGVRSYLITLDGDKLSTSEIVESASSGYSYASFTGLNMDDGEYTISVTGINEVKMYSQKRSARFVLVTHPPKLTGTAIRTTWSKSTSTASASWDNVFVSTDPIYYEVSARLVEGGDGDLVQWQETVNTRIEIVLDTSEMPESGVTVRFSVRAISFSGYFKIAHNDLFVLP